ncbi:MAG: ROK family protein [Clostridia bacterium]|nr:ROK family protein [Clostridia bacterium]
MKIGIDLGGSHVGVGLIEGCNLIDTDDKFFLSSDKENIEAAIERNIEELTERLIEKNNISMDSIESIGVASPGTIADGKIKSWNLGLDFYDLKSVLENKYHKIVNVRNDGKCAAMAEKKFGILKDYDDCVFVNIGTGIGGAAFIGGKLLEPKKYSGFEFGHMTIVKDGIKCTCGKSGCFERYASIKSLKQRVTKTLDIDGTDMSGQYMREVLMVQNEETLRDDVNDFVNCLRIGIANLIDIFEPEVVCFGGSFSYYEGYPVYNQFLEEIAKDTSTFNKNLPRFVTAEFKNDAGIIGATIF